MPLGREISDEGEREVGVQGRDGGGGEEYEVGQGAHAIGVRSGQGGGERGAETPPAQPRPPKRAGHAQPDTPRAKRVVAITSRRHHNAVAQPEVG